MKRSSLMVGVYLLLVFVSGALVGAFGHRLYSANAVSAKNPGGHEAFRKRYVSEMETRLKLDQDQLRKFISILDESKDRYRVTRDRIEPALKQIQLEHRANIRAILRPEQVAEYEKMLEEREKRRKAQTSSGNR
ncbi:MAG TPA: hypothetical protein VM120_24310 [Bryobacteraceae bacterium]|nr:hypothetical protein [Bryobacteraceae bacterium]